MNTLLTIAVPTFNRADKLENCLNILLRETGGKPVELLVSDNASEDGTEALMTRLCQEHPHITYIRNPENIGPDRNFLNCYNRARGTYTLLLGDDDFLLPGAVDHILQTLSQNPVFVHLNTCGLRSTEPLEYTQPRVEEGEDLVYTSREAFMQDIGIYITFMSSLILRTDLVAQVPDKEHYIGTYFIQSHIALNTLKTQGQYTFITKNCIAATGNQTVSYDLYFVWGKMYGQLLKQTGTEIGMDPAFIKELHKKDLEGMIFGFVKQYRLSCPWSRNWKKACILSQVKPYPKLYMKYLAALCLPKALLKAAIKRRNINA